MLNMGLSDLIAGGMDATAATELLLNVVWTIVGATLVYFMQLVSQCVKPVSHAPKILETFL